MGSIVWNGISSRAIPIIVENPPRYVSAERDYEVEHVPGRNGDLIHPSDSFKNVERSYDIAFGSLEIPHSELAAATSEWLRAPSGYARLEDSYEPDYYRMAYYQQESDFENILNHLGRGTITFNCMPQRYLKSGETMLTFDLTNVRATDEDPTVFSLRNPTSFPAYPNIYIFGNGDISVFTGGTTDSGVVFRNLTEPIMINAEKKGVYTHSIHHIGDPESAWSWNIWGGKYLSEPLHIARFYIDPEYAYVRVRILKGSFTKMEVVPRWYTI